jgi:uncharacterized DUF497 family protein
MAVEFEWDPAKSETTYQTRGFDFAYASRIFDTALVVAEDTRADYGEIRMKAIGQIGSDVLVVIYTLRGDAIRIIPARRANKKERAQWLSRA